MYYKILKNNRKKVSSLEIKLESYKSNCEKGLRNLHVKNDVFEVLEDNFNCSKVKERMYSAN